MTATTADLKQMFEAGYQAAFGTTVNAQLIARHLTMQL
jgi:hypothetical protein